MNKTKAAVVLVATIVVAIAISGWYAHTMEIGEPPHIFDEVPPHLLDATPNTYIKALFFLSPSSQPYIQEVTFKNYNETNLRERYGRCCFSQIGSHEYFDKYSPRVMHHNSFIEMVFAFRENEPTKEEILGILGDDLTIEFSSYDGIPPVERKVENIEFVDEKDIGYSGVAIFDIGDYSVRFEDATPRYTYTLLVLSNTEIGAVDISFFNFETIALSGEVGELQPLSNWHYHAGRRDMGNIYFVQVAPKNASYPSKTVAPNFVTTTSSYEKVEGELVELITQKYEVEVFFEPLEKEKDD